jgi:hypothetical protein
MPVRSGIRDMVSTMRGVKPIQWFFLIIAGVAILVGHILQLRAFPESTPSPFSQISVSV